MSRLPLALLLALAISLAARAETPSPLAAPAPAATPTAAPADSAVDRAHALSSATSARVVTALPRFAPRDPAAVARPAADLRDTDRPRNTIVRLPRSLLPPAPETADRSDASRSDEPAPAGVLRLPRYEVRDRQLPALKNREILTPEAKIALEFKRHPGLKIGNLFGLNRGIAFAMAEEDDAYERRLEMADLLDLQSFAGAHPARDPDSDSSPAAASPTADVAPATPSSLPAAK